MQRPLQTLLLLVCPACLFTGCGDQSQPQEAPPAEPASQTTSKELPDLKLSAEDEARLDEEWNAFLANRKDQEHVELLEFLGDPRIIDLMSDMMDELQSDPKRYAAYEVRLYEAMQTLTVASGLAPMEVDEEGGFVNDGNMLVLKLDDPDFMRQLLARILTQDAEGYLDLLLSEMEDSAAEKLANPESSSKLHMETMKVK